MRSYIGVVFPTEKATVYFPGGKNGKVRKKLVRKSIDLDKEECLLLMELRRR